ncbi:MAG: hypothetical protein Q7R83_01245, partial [bacterium]|nr:hypothetical protein [bacterium]
MKNALESSAMKGATNRRFIEEGLEELQDQHQEAKQAKELEWVEDRVSEIIERYSYAGSTQLFDDVEHLYTRSPIASEIAESIIQPLYQALVDLDQDEEDGTLINVEETLSHWRKLRRLTGVRPSEQLMENDLLTSVGRKNCLQQPWAVLYKQIEDIETEEQVFPQGVHAGAVPMHTLQVLAIGQQATEPILTQACHAALADRTLAPGDRLYFIETLNKLFPNAKVAFTREEVTDFLDQVIFQAKNFYH